MPMTHSESGQPDGVRLSIVVPVYNEEESIDRLHSEITSGVADMDATYEVIYVNDGSNDTTMNRLRAIHEKDEHVRVFNFRRNFGQGAALSCGFENARGEVIVPLDADLQNDPADIPALMARLNEGYDVVAGWRKNRHDPFSKRFPSKIANWIIGKVTGCPIHDYGCTLKAYRADAIRDIKFYAEMHRFILLPAMASWQGAKWVEVTVNHRPRQFGQSKYGIFKTFKVVLDLLTVKFIGGYGSRPIYVFGAVSMALFGGAVLSGLGTLYRKLVLGSPMIQSPLLILTVMLVVLSALFMSLGLTAELVVRLSQESSDRPLYALKEELDH
jgi:glycosyltransferase involved in cell wall biosynthesis